jgi:hypothetical protein
MDCMQAKELVPEWLRGELDGESAAEVRAHVGSCAECSAWAEEVRRIAAGLGHLETADAAAERRVRAKALAGLARPRPAPVLAKKGEGGERETDRPLPSGRRRAVRRAFGGTELARYALPVLGAAAALLAALILLPSGEERARPVVEGHRPPGYGRARPGPRKGARGDGPRPWPRPESEAPAPRDGRAAAADSGEIGPPQAGREETPAAGDDLQRGPAVAERAPGPFVPADDLRAPAPSRRGSLARPENRRARLRRAGASGESLGELVGLEGRVELARAGTDGWLAARDGTPLQLGDRVRTKLSRARIELDSGSVVRVNRWTTLTLAEEATPPGLSMVGGEVYIETVPQDRGFRVETPHGRALDLGTRFGVETGIHATTIVCVKGRVEASTDGGRVELGDGQEVRLARRTAPPGVVRDARDLDRRLAWATGDAVKPRAASDDILLTARDGRLVGSDWRLVRDGEAIDGVCLESTFVGHAPGPRPSLRPHYVEFGFSADANKDYRIWIRGKCAADESLGVGRPHCDAVDIKPDEGTFNHHGWPGDFYRRHNVADFNGFSNRQGYWWMSGNMDGEADRDNPIILRFTRKGRHILRLYAIESPMRIDRIWLSATQREIPAPETGGR